MSPARRKMSGHCNVWHCGRHGNRASNRPGEIGCAGGQLRLSRYPLAQVQLVMPEFWRDFYQGMELTDAAVNLCAVTDDLFEVVEQLWV